MLLSEAIAALAKRSGEGGASEIVFGTVKCASPLEIAFNGIVVGEENLILTESVSAQSVNVTVGNETRTIEIRRALLAGDKVAGARKGTYYVVFGRI